MSNVTKKQRGIGYRRQAREFIVKQLQRLTHSRNILRLIHEQEVNPLPPPYGQTQQLFQAPPAESNFLSQFIFTSATALSTHGSL